MYLQRFFVEGLAHASYLFGAEDEAAVVDPKRDVDLTVTSTHGHTGFMHVLIRSVAEGIVRHAHCPVLVVPRRRAAASGTRNGRRRSRTTKKPAGSSA